MIGGQALVAALFFETFAFFIVLTAVLYGMIFLMTIIVKGKTDAKTLLCVVVSPVYLEVETKTKYIG